MAKQIDRQLNRATLQEVATRAGVSMTTASLVLAGKATHRRISEAAHTKVRKAAEELNYAPNLLVRSLRRGRTNIVSFYNTFRKRQSQDLYVDKLSTAVELAGGAHGYDVLMHCNFDRSLQETYQFLNGGLADGLLIFAPTEGDPLVEHLRKSNLPVVLLNHRDPVGMFPSVADDCVAGMEMVANALLDLGHRRIAALTREAPDVRDSHRRITLLRHFLGLRDVTIPDDWIIDFATGDIDRLAALLQQPDPPTAIFCWHDRTAYYALEACEKLHVSVPDQLSIVGYDGLRWPAATSHVAASVKVDLELLANRGLRLLDLYIQGYEGPLIEEILPVTFCPGSTLAPPCNP